MQEKIGINARKKQFSIILQYIDNNKKKGATNENNSMDCKG